MSEIKTSTELILPRVARTCFSPLLSLRVGDFGIPISEVSSYEYAFFFAECSLCVHQVNKDI